MSYQDWASSLAKKAIAGVRVDRIQAIAAREDMTLPVLEGLLETGYTEVTWDSGHTRHSTCLELNHQRWRLADFLTGLEFSAPMAERSHPNDTSCTLIVSGPEVPPMRVSYDGRAEEI